MINTREENFWWGQPLQKGNLNQTLCTCNSELKLFGHGNVLKQFHEILTA